MWDDIIGEPEGIKSTQCAWNCSYKCFRGTNRCCYILLTTLFGPCLAFCSAINFACLAFQVSNANNNEAAFFKLAGRRDVGYNAIAIGLSKLEIYKVCSNQGCRLQLSNTYVCLTTLDLKMFHRARKAFRKVSFL